MTSTLNLFERKLTLKLTLFLSLVVFVFNGEASQRAHVHGEVNLSIVFEKNKGRIEFTSPLGNLVGFESMHKIKKDKSMLLELEEKFSNLKKPLFIFSEKNQCQLVVQKNGINDVDHASDSHQNKHDKKKHSDHKDWIAYFEVECKGEAKMAEITIDLRSFKEIQLIHFVIMVDEWTYTKDSKNELISVTPQ